MSIDPFSTKASPQPIDMSEVLVDPSWSLRIPASLARRRKAIPCCQINGEVIVACVDPEDSQMLDSLERHLQCPVKTVIAEEVSLDQLIGRVFGGTASQSSSVRGSGTAGVMTARLSSVMN